MRLGFNPSIGVGNAALLSRGKELIDTIRQRRHRGPRSQNLNTVSQEADSDELLDGVMHAAAQWVTGRLARYREFDEAAPVPELVELLVSCQKCLGEQKRVTEVYLVPYFLNRWHAISSTEDSPLSEVGINSSLKLYLRMRSGYLSLFQQKFNVTLP